MNDSLQTLMQEATRLTREGRLTEATEAIQRALRPTASAESSDRAHDDESIVLDGCVFEVSEPPLGGMLGAAGFQPGPTLHVPLPQAQAKAREPAVASEGPGEFVRGGHAKGSLQLAYKLYVPPNHAGRALPLVVMLHGCTQNPDDFAAGTGMNERAREEGFFVLYPEQSASANPQACWNWFKHNHQARGRGEPAAIVAATQEVMRQYGIDARRVYIAGLSAGGAMAHIVALAYPDIFAAVGVHSGLPCGAAGNVSEALMAMKSGAATRGSPRKASRAEVAHATSSERPQPAVPTIVFHGDHDATVHPRNGEQIVAATLRHAQAQGGDSTAASPAPVRVEQGVSRLGRPYTRSVSRDVQARVLTEHWLVHGAGHAWSGGSAAGSYTDAQGPDATGEMLRFFFEHPRA